MPHAWATIFEAEAHLFYPKIPPKINRKNKNPRNQLILDPNYWNTSRPVPE
jgi:hypothetical protein